MVVLTFSKKFRSATMIVLKVHLGSLSDLTSFDKVTSRVPLTSKVLFILSCCFTTDKCVSNAFYRLFLAHFDPISPLSSLFLLPFPFYFIHLIILDHSDILLDFQSFLTKFLVHLFLPYFAIFLL